MSPGVMGDLGVAGELDEGETIISFSRFKVESSLLADSIVAAKVPPWVLLLL